MDAYAHAAELVREGDRDRYLADLFAPGAVRRHLLALHALNVEVTRIRERVSDPMPGEIRLQWWRDALAGDAGGNPVAVALKETIATYSLPLAAFDSLLEARIFDLYSDAMPKLADLEGYLGETSSGLMQLGAIILAGGDDPGTAEVAGYAGVALGLTGIMRTLPIQAVRRQSFLPGDLVASHGLNMADVFAGRRTPALDAVLAELRGVARERLGAATRAWTGADPKLLPAFLPAALVGPELRRMEKPAYDPLHPPADLSPWRRHWTLWRAARRGTF